AEEVQKYTLRGAPKTAKFCKTKWADLRETYHVIAALLEQSRFIWSADHGVQIDECSETVWQEYVKKHLKAAPFRNKGWPHFEAMQAIM
ncbi:uncharacterized protein LAESUDRAFT_631897, partial [Laetiporus sulphureus 93-53]